jgi:phage shock protein A
MPSLWERLKRLITLRARRDRAKEPLRALEAYQKKLFASMDRLTWQYLKLGEIRQQLRQRGASLERLAQRYDDQARKHYKLGQIDLAETALRERLKHEAELRRLHKTIGDLEKQLASLRAHKERLAGQLQLYHLHKEAIELRYRATQAELEARELQVGLGGDDLPDLRGTLETAEEEIREIQAELEALEEMQEELGEDELGRHEIDDEEIHRELERWKGEEARRGSRGKGR